MFSFNLNYTIYNTHLFMCLKNKYYWFWFFFISIWNKYCSTKIMNICWLNIGSKIRFKCRAACHTPATTTAFPERGGMRLAFAPLLRRTTTFILFHSFPTSRLYIAAHHRTPYHYHFQGKKWKFTFHIKYFSDTLLK